MAKPVKKAKKAVKKKNSKPKTKLKSSKPKTKVKKAVKRKKLTKAKKEKIIKRAVKKTAKSEPKLDMRNYIRITTKDDPTKFKELGEQVQQRLIKFVHFSDDNGVGVFYYKKIN